jgi:ABC-type dipeptide/oligopeptide/nickel transport system ATPase component
MNKINNPILKIKNLKCFFYTERGVVKALNGVNWLWKEFNG